MKRVVPAQSGLLVGIGFYGAFGNASGSVANLGVGVKTDISGHPGNILSISTTDSTIEVTSVPRWHDLPVSCYLTAGTPYWLAWVINSSAVTSMVMYWDGTGSDWQLQSNGGWISDTAIWASANQNRIYSIRGLFLSPL